MGNIPLGHSNRRVPNRRVRALSKPDYKASFWVMTFKFVTDAVLWLLAAPLAFVLRVDDLAAYGLSIAFYTLVTAPIKIGLLWLNELYRQTWRRAGLYDLYILARAVAIYSGITVSLVWAWHAFGLSRPQLLLPRSLPFLEAALSLLLLGGVRFVRRWLGERRARSHSPQSRHRVLLAGAGEAGTLMVREMQRHPEMGFEPVGFLDDDPAKWGATILGVPVLGPLDALPQALREHRVDEVLIAMPSASGRVVRRIIEACQQAGVAYRTMPALHEILSGKVLIQQIREVRVEDLLRREPIQLDLETIASYLAGKVVLVTGAGGSIGSEIVRQMIRFRPQRLILLGRGENSLYELEKSLRFDWPGLHYDLVVADVRDLERLRLIFERTRPQIVFHAAAHKHVPLMELNPEEAILNNVFGTQHVVQVARDMGVERLVNISTDKAVNPTSIMGASKRVAEYVVQVAAAQARPGQVFVSVRFGNVLGSRGSVVPLFQEQIRRGGPVTVTHPEVKRYFMTIAEAAQLVLQAGGLGDNGAVYVLDMGEPIKIVDLARDLIRLSGLTEETIPIVFTGLRPGEKLFEELLTAEEGVVSSRHEKIFVARTAPVNAQWLETHLAMLREAARQGNAARIRDVLRQMIPTYRPWQTDSAPAVIPPYEPHGQ